MAICTKSVCCKCLHVFGHTAVRLEQANKTNENHLVDLLGFIALESSTTVRQPSARHSRHAMLHGSVVRRVVERRARPEQFTSLIISLTCHEKMCPNALNAFCHWPLHSCILQERANAHRHAGREKDGGRAECSVFCPYQCVIWTLCRMLRRGVVEVWSALQWCA